MTQGVKECERGLEWVMEGRSREKERKIKKCVMKNCSKIYSNYDH